MTCPDPRFPTSTALRVSVIIPTLNEAQRVGWAIQAAWAAGADEVIVVDGGSQDETVAVAGAANCRILVSERGRARQMNAGAADSTGEALVFLHADTWLVSRGIDQIREVLRDSRVEGGAFRQRIDAMGIRYRWLEVGNAWRARRLGLPYGDQGIFIRRDTFFQLGGFPDVRLLEDVILARRMRRRTRPVLLPGPLHVSARRWQGRGVVRQTLRNWGILAAYFLGVSPDRLARHYV